MEKLFLILAVILAGIAAYFLWQGSGETAFILIALAVVAYFLNMRLQIKGRLTRWEANRRAEEEEEETGRQGELIANYELGITKETIQDPKSKIQNRDDSRSK